MSATHGLFTHYATPGEDPLSSVLEKLRPLSDSLSQFVLIVVMKAKELMTKISHTHSLTLSRFVTSSRSIAGCETVSNCTVVFQTP